MTIPKPSAADGLSAAEIFELAVIELAEGMKKLSSTRLKEDTIIILLHAATGHPKKMIRDVLNALGNLEHTFLKPKGGK